MLLDEVRTEELLELDEEELDDDDPEYLFEYWVPGRCVLMSRYSLHDGYLVLNDPPAYEPCGTPKFTGLAVVVVPPPSTLPMNLFLLPPPAVCTSVELGLEFVPDMLLFSKSSLK